MADDRGNGGAHPERPVQLHGPVETLLAFGHGSLVGPAGSSRRRHRARSEGVVAARPGVPFLRRSRGQDFAAQALAFLVGEVTAQVVDGLGRHRPPQDGVPRPPGDLARPGHQSFTLAVPERHPMPACHQDQDLWAGVHDLVWELVEHGLQLQRVHGFDILGRRAHQHHGSLAGVTRGQEQSQRRSQFASPPVLLCRRPHRPGGEGEKVARWSRTGPGRSHHWPREGAKGRPAVNPLWKNPSSPVAASTTRLSRSGRRATCASEVRELGPRVATASSRMAATAAAWPGPAAAAATASAASPVRAARATARTVAAVHPPVTLMRARAASGAGAQPEAGPAQRQGLVRVESELLGAQVKILGPVQPPRPARELASQDDKALVTLEPGGKVFDQLAGVQRGRGERRR